MGPSTSPSTKACAREALPLRAFHRGKTSPHSRPTTTASAQRLRPLMAPAPYPQPSSSKKLAVPSPAVPQGEAVAGAVRAPSLSREDSRARRSPRTHPPVGDAKPEPLQALDASP